MQWTGFESNPQPVGCESDTLPLHHCTHAVKSQGLGVSACCRVIPAAVTPGLRVLFSAASRYDYAVVMSVELCVPQNGPITPQIWHKSYVIQYNTNKFLNAPYMSIRKRIWSAAMAPEQLKVGRFKQFSFKPVLKCQTYQLNGCGHQDSKRAPDCRSSMEKTRMAWLPDGDKILRLSLFVLTEYTNVMDTHRHRMST